MPSRHSIPRSHGIRVTLRQCLTTREVNYFLGNHRFPTVYGKKDYALIHAHLVLTYLRHIGMDQSIQVSIPILHFYNFIVSNKPCHVQQRGHHLCSHEYQ